MQGGYWLITKVANQFGPNSTLSFNTGITDEFTLAGNDQTVAGLIDSGNYGVIENSHSYLPTYFGTALATNVATLTVNNSTTNTFTGWLRNNGVGTTNTADGGLWA